MIYNVRIMRPAQNEMREIYRYIADELRNPVAAARRISLIDEKIQSLKENPARIPLVRDDYLASKGHRMIIAKNHLVFFIIREEIKAVSVMRVLYGRRDWLRILRVEADSLKEFQEAMKDEAERVGWRSDDDVVDHIMQMRREEED